jgi:3-hydroxy-3-methylglutaryl CoA synthase
MAGITAIGAYIPRYRLSAEEIAGFWRIRAAGGEKAVAGYDEDSLTMAVAAAQDCLRRSASGADGLYFATTTCPYREKQGAALIASAVDLKKESRTADFTGSLRAGSIAMGSALDAVASGAAAGMLVAASDCRMGAPQGRLEPLLGDGAAAVLVGSERAIAELEGRYTIFSDFTDFWRTGKDDFVQSAEGRFIDAEGYLPTMQEAVSALMKKLSAAPGDFSRIVYYAADNRQHADLAKRLGFEKSRVQDPLFSQIGNTGAAASLLMLASALEEARPGDRILFAAYGDGCDVFAFRVTESIGEIRQKIGLKERLSKKVPVDYGKYLHWKDLAPVETANLPQRSEPSIITRWRDRRSIAALYGVRCRSCGTPQLHPIGQNIRVCAACQAKDDFEPYKFSDKKGKLFSYAVDQLQPTKNPPGLNGVVDFDGGGRLICELTDYDLDRVAVGMPVEMTFRRMLQGEGILNYFWKARPAMD